MAPVIIIGAARTGTTWLSNILLENFGLFTPNHFLHYGVKESQLFELSAYYQAEPDKVKALQKLAQTDLFVLLNYEKFKDQVGAPADYRDIFFELMDRNAQAMNTQWFFKLCPEYLYDSREMDLLLPFIQKRYKTFKVIVIKRSFKDYLLSYINMPGKNKGKRSKSILSFSLAVLAAARYRVIYSSAAAFFKTAHTLTYEDLVADFKGTISKLSQYLDLPFRASAKSVLQNSSDREVQVGSPVVSVAWKLTFSQRLNRFMIAGYSKLAKRTPQFYNRIFLYDHDFDQLVGHLSGRGEHKLLEKVKSKHASA